MVFAQGSTRPRSESCWSICEIPARVESSGRCQRPLEWEVLLPNLSPGGEDAVLLGKLRDRRGRDHPAKDLTMVLFKSATGDLADQLETEQA